MQVTALTGMPLAYANEGAGTAVASSDGGDSSSNDESNSSSDGGNDSSTGDNSSNDSNSTSDGQNDANTGGSDNTSNDNSDPTGSSDNDSGICGDIPNSDTSENGDAGDGLTGSENTGDNESTEPAAGEDSDKDSDTGENPGINDSGAPNSESEPAKNEADTGDEPVNNDPADNNPATGDPVPNDPVNNEPEDDEIDADKTSAGTIPENNEENLLEPEMQIMGMPAILNSVLDGIETEIDTNVIHTIIATKNDKKLQEIENYRPQMGDKIDLELKFTLPVEHDYGNGSILTYELPSPLCACSGNGSLSKDTVEYATYKIEDGNVVVTFNGNIRFEGIGGTKGLETKGWFEIEAEFKSDNKDLTQALELPNEGKTITIDLHFQPVNGKTIEKTVDPENEGNNSKHVQWTVTVNTVMNDLGENGKEFKDTLTGKHTYDKGTLKITRMELGADGTVLSSEKINLATSWNKDAEDNEGFSLNLTGKYAYEIEYQTIPGDTDEEEETLKNKATFDNKTDTQPTKIKFGAPLIKSVSKDGETANWTITVNQNRKTLAENTETKIIDTWSSTKHAMIADSFIVKGLNTGNYEYKKSEDENENQTGFTLTLKSATSEPFTITYSTKPKDLVTGTINIENTVYRSDRENDKKIVTAKYSQNVLSKLNSNINYQSKTVDWKIVINSAGYEMSNIVLDDKFVNENLTIVEGSFKINDNALGEGYDLVKKENKEGFTLTFPDDYTAPNKIIITYTTKYDIKNVDAGDGRKNYINKASLSWKTNGKEYSVKDVESSVTINDQQVNNGYKTGEYNYGEKKFKWSVGINYNFDTVKNPIFTDTLPKSQKVLRDSIKVYKLNLSGGGDGAIEGTPLNEGDGKDYALNLNEGNSPHTFTITFNKEINKPYLITYESINNDEYYAPKEDKENHTITNDAKFDGSSWNKDVKVEHTNTLLTKDFKQEGSSAKLHWTMNLNWGQSTLKDVVITDKVGDDENNHPNQMVYKDSFKIYEMEFSGTNPTPTKVATTINSNLYEIKFDEQDCTFKITFKNTIEKAHTIEYDTYFLGATKTELKNTATLSYKTKDGNTEGEDKAEFIKASFTHSGGASTSKGRLEITKVDKDDDNKKLSGAEFELWSAGNDGFLIERVSTDTDGVYKFLTMVGQTDYYLKETKAPEGYSLDESTYKTLQKVHINQETTPWTIKNPKIRQSIKLTKTDGTNPLSGAEFKLYKKNEENSYKMIIVTGDSLVTDPNGVILVKDLKPGDYRLIETKAPNGYWLDTRPVDLKVVAGQIEVTEKTMVNYRQGTVTLKKVDAGDKTIPLAGATFKLTMLDTGDKEINTDEATLEATTNEDGIATFEKVKYGKFKVKEITAPDGYLLDSESDIVEGITRTLDSETMDLDTFTNKKIINAFRLVKTDDKNENLLAGAEFDLYVEDTDNNYVIAKDENNKEYTGLTTNESGEIQIGNLPAGNYRLKETKAPPYYLPPDPDNKYDFEIKENQTDFSKIYVTNTRGTGKIIITKVDAANDNNKIKDTKFTLTNSQRDLVITETTDESGQIVFEDLPYDTYILKEIKSHPDYLDNEDEIEIVLDSNEDKFVYERTIENTKADRSVTLTKYNNSKSLKLKGAVFELRKETGTGENTTYEVVSAYETLTTDDNGEITLTDLQAGNYQLIETKAPAGYRLNSEPVDFEITQKQEATIQLEKTNARIQIIPETITVTAEKVWAGGPDIKPDIELQLYRNGDKLGNPVLLANGVTEYAWEGLDEVDTGGNAYNYTVDEINVPKGYTKSISADGLTITNEYLDSAKDVTAKKVWIGGPDTKPTIELQLYRNGDKFGETVEMTGGLVEYTWSDLNRADDKGNEYTYTVDEVNVPENYTKSISADGLTVTNTYQGEKEYKITLVANPSTIVGDGKSESVLTSTVTDEKGDPVADVKVVFDAPNGTFHGDPDHPEEGKNTGITGPDGKARVKYRSDKIEGIESIKIPVKATVEDKEKDLYAEDTIYVTFEPASIKGVVTDNNTNEPIEGAKIVVTNNEGFRAEQTTGPDGKYKIAIPKGDMLYDVEITKPITLNGEKVDVSFKQKAEPGKIDESKKDEEFPAKETFTGIIITKDKDGNDKIACKDTADKIVIKQIKADGSIEEKTVVDSNGVFTVEELEANQTHEFVILMEKDGYELVVSKMTVTLDKEGEISIHEELIDPYGTVIDGSNNKILEDVHVELFYADTSRNRANGKSPHTWVELPGLPGFAPNDNQNPQYSTNTTIYNEDVQDYSNYAWMVFPKTDYYIVGTKDGYHTYTSDTITVEYEVVKHNFIMWPIDPEKPSGGGGGGGGGSSKPKPKPEEPEEPVEPIKPVVPVELIKPVDPIDQPEPIKPIEIPQYTQQDVPDPNLPSSPDQFILIDQRGERVDDYTKQQKAGGKYDYVDSDNIPLGSKRLPQTGDQAPVLLLLFISLASIGGAAYLIRHRNKQYN